MNDVRSAQGGGRGERAAAAVNSQRRAGPSGAGIPRPPRTEPPEPRRCCSAAGSGLGAAAVGGARRAASLAGPRRERARRGANFLAASACGWLRPRGVRPPADPPRGAGACGRGAGKERPEGPGRRVGWGAPRPAKREEWGGGRTTETWFQSGPHARHPGASFLDFARLRMDAGLLSLL